MDVTLTLMITLQLTQKTNLSSYNSLLPRIEGSFTVLTISNKDNIVNRHSLLLD